MEDKIMAGGNLQNILNRLAQCHALLSALAKSEKSDILHGIADLLRCIVNDFETDVDCANDAPTTTQ